MVSILLWVRRQTQKAREAGSHRRNGRQANNQNTSIGLDTSFGVPTGLSSFNLEKKPAPHSHLYHSYAKAPLEARAYGPSRQGSISISNSPTVPYQIPVAGATTIGPSSSQTSLATGFGPRSNERPVIRSLHRVNSDIFKPLPEPPAAALGETATSTPPPAPVNSFAFPSSDSKRESAEKYEQSHLPHIVTSSSTGYQGNGVEQIKPIAPLSRPHHPYAPFADAYAPNRPRHGSNVSTGSLGITLGGTGSLTREKENPWGGVGSSRGGYDSRPRSQSLTSIQYGSSYRPQPGSIYQQHASGNASLTSLSYYPDATSADGLARSYSQTVLARPESRASSITSKKFENQLFSR